MSDRPAERDVRAARAQSRPQARDPFAGYDADGPHTDGQHADGYKDDGYKDDGYNDDGYNDDGYEDDGYDAFFSGGDGGRNVSRRSAGRGDYVRIPRRVNGDRRLAVVSVLAVLALVAVVGGAAWWVKGQYDPAGAPGELITIDIPEGSTAQDISTILGDSGIVANARVFQEYVRLQGKGPFKAGTYELARNSSVSEALKVLDTGPAAIGYAEATFPEGLRLSELVPALVKAVPRFDPARVQAALDNGAVRSRFQPAGATSLEGFLFPDTYRIEDNLSEVQALQLMATQFDKVAGELRLAERAAALGLTPLQVVTIASLIEEEARVPDERPIIARVIYNRLGGDMRLDIDATTLYAVGKTGNELTVTDLDSDSPYNTRKAKGIPPGPIAAPGRASMEAALAPAQGTWLFYVLADADGRHFFTDDFGAFERQVAISAEKGLLG